MHSLIENAKLACELIPILERLVFGSGFLLFLIYEFACFFRFLLRSWREHARVHPRGHDRFIEPFHYLRDSGSIVGRATDPNGAVVPGATGTAKNKGTGKESTASTSSSGNLDIRQLSTGVFGRVAPRDYQAVHDLYRAAQNYKVPGVKLRLVRQADDSRSSK